jgi:signal peptidase I
MFNMTNSVPHTLFLVHTTSLPKKGEYALVDHPQFERFLIKKVAGLEGDVVDTNSSQILLNNQIVGALKERTSTGGKLTPIASQFIPAGKFFVLGESANSYDSRYANFGLVDHSQVRGTAWPLF